MRQTVTTLPLRRLRHACALLLLVCLAGALTASAQQNDNTAPKANTKNIAGMSASDAPGGAKVTITSDGALNDYSAYRSGDRFYVVIPQAKAKGGGGVRGRGFEGAQVQQRGQDVVMSFKLQPGASARVDQRFNRLVVQFNAPEVGAQPPARNANQSVAQPTPSAAVENAGVPTPTPAVRPTPAVKPTPTPGVLPAGVIPTPLTQATPLTALPSPSVTPTPTPAATPTQQIAQLQATPPAPVSVTTTNPPVTAAAPVSLGTTILRNWPWLLIALIALAALGLFVVARGTERRADLPPAVEPPALKETPKAALPVKEPVAPVAAAVTPAVVAAPVVAPTTKKEKKGKKGRRRPDRAPAAAAEPATEAARPQEVAAPPAVEVDETAAAGAAEAGVLAAAGAAALATEVAQPAGASTRAAEEARKLLAGEEYDEAVIGATDAPTRQAVAAELMTALATESEGETGARARTAFLQHGYFDDATLDLRAAEEPKQRASAARTLGLVGDRAATPHLVAALEDPAPEVRRASVEALTELQDPAAAKPLEALRWRETSPQLPRKLIQEAIEACAVAAAVAPAVETPAADATAFETIAVADEETTQEMTPPGAEAAEEITLQAPPVVAAPSVAPAPEVETEAVTAPAEETVEAVAAPVAEPELTEEAEVAEAVEPALAAAPAVAPEPLVEPAQTFEPEAEAVQLPAEPAAAEVVAPSQATMFEPPATVEHADIAEDVTLAATEAAAPALDEAATAETMTPTLPADEAAAVPGAPEATEMWRELGAEFTEPARAGEVEPPVAEAQEETKAITAFAMSPGTPTADDWIDVDVEEHRPGGAFTRAITPAAEQHVSLDTEATEHAPVASSAADEVTLAGHDAAATAERKEIDLPGAEEERLSIIPKAIQVRLESEDVGERAASVLALARLNTDEAFHQICAAFDDSASEVREAAARALYSLADDRADSFTRALREAPPERRRHIGAAISSSGLADEAVSNLTGESRDKTYDAFSLLFLMAKAGETAPLIHAIETHPDNEVRLAVVKLLALSGQHEILPSFRRLAVRGSLPTEVRSAVMEAIYQISSQPQHTT